MTSNEQSINNMSIEEMNNIGEMLSELFKLDITRNCREDVITALNSLSDDYGFSGLASVATAYINR